ncbi:MAG TPA: DUF2442 domain-containing protein [Thermosynechococcaceae cyanobacterium]
MDSTQLQQENLQRQIADAKARSSIAHLTEPRAEAAYFEQETGRIVIHLQYGAVFSFLAELGQGLSGATPEDLAEVEVTPSGMGLHWEKLDADLSVPALLNGIYGNSSWMEQLKH